MHSGLPASWCEGINWMLFQRGDLCSSPAVLTFQSSKPLEAPALIINFWKIGIMKASPYGDTAGTWVGGGSAEGPLRSGLPLKLSVSTQGSLCYISHPTSEKIHISTQGRGPFRHVGRASLWIRGFPPASSHWKI